MEVSAPKCYLHSAPVSKFMGFANRSCLHSRSSRTANSGFVFFFYSPTCFNYLSVAAPSLGTLEFALACSAWFPNLSFFPLKNCLIQAYMFRCGALVIGEIPKSWIWYNVGSLSGSSTCRGVPPLSGVRCWRKAVSCTAHSVSLSRSQTW